MEGRRDRQGGGCGLCALRTGARHRCQQCTRPKFVGGKFLLPALLGLSGDRKGDLERADELASKALALDPDWTWTHLTKASVLRAQGRAKEAVVQAERALALDPSNVEAAGELGFDYVDLGEFEKALNISTKAIRASPHDPAVVWWYMSASWSNFVLKNYDLAIEQARKSIAINPEYYTYSYPTLVAALVLTGHDAEAREALQRYLALPSIGPLNTIAGMKADDEAQRTKAQFADPRFVGANDRLYAGLRKAGMPEK
jgi:adenylate cyclase